jgi:serine protease Do
VRIFRLQAPVLLAAMALLAAVQIVTAPVAMADLRDLLPFGRAHRISRLLPVVVAISTHKIVKDKPGPSGEAEPRRIESFGAGFIVDPAGYIATNRHVIEDATDITVTLQDGTAVTATIIGIATHIDLALLKIDVGKPLPIVKWGDSSRVHIGDQVLVIGNPLGIGETVSSGIVSALNRDIMLGPYDDFIQTDAAINHGNSGGPLFDMKGEVIGVNTALYTPTEEGGSVGLGFAIPGNDTQYVLGQLRKFGRVPTGWLGARTQDVTPDIADALGLSPPRGTIISGLDKDGPAEHAKLRAGDVILKFGKDVPHDMRALARLAGEAVGETVPLLIWRDGKEQTIPITITEWVEAPKPANGDTAAPVRLASTQPADLGLHTGPLTDDARAKYKLGAAQSGVLVVEVAPNTTAADRGVAAGDVILRVQEAPVSAPGDVQKAFEDARRQNRHHILILVDGKDGMRWVPLPLS